MHVPMQRGAIPDPLPVRPMPASPPATPGAGHHVWGAVVAALAAAAVTAAAAIGPGHSVADTDLPPPPPAALDG